jgi:hypothetical protein
MATANPNPVNRKPTTLGQGATSLLVLVSSGRPEQFHAILANLTQSFPSQSLLIAGMDGIAPESFPHFQFVPGLTRDASWILTAADFANAFELARGNDARAVLMLGAEAVSLSATALRELAAPILTSSIDLTVPRYEIPPHAGLVNSAILYPLSRALFGCGVRYPLAIDLCLSLRMSERIATGAQRFVSLNQAEVPLWPVNEAAQASFSCREVEVGTRDLPAPPDPDLNSVLPLVAGSLFADIEAKASFWQRPRSTPTAGPRPSAPRSVPPDATPDIGPMIEAFRLAFTNLREIWSLVLPPNSLLGLKRLSVSTAVEFCMPDSLWARIVYDYVLAYRLRTINRSHLLGALLPLYLAWVASHINLSNSGTDSERHIEALAAAFETDKPYLVSRWRWPDRFSP